MLRRTRLARLGYTSHDVHQDAALGYSPFGWHYSLPQNMVAPWRVNRVMTKPFFDRNKRFVTYAPGVYVGSTDEMNPAMFEALRPWLSKLALGRTVPATDPAEAIEDFKKIAARIDTAAAASNSAENRKTVRCWLAKVLQLCAMKNASHSGAADAGLELWKSLDAADATAAAIQIATTTTTVETSFVTAVLYCAAQSSADSEAFAALFQRASASAPASSAWKGATSRLPTRLWDCMLRRCGQKGDEAGVVLLLRELVDIHFDLDVLCTHSLVIALNCVKSDAVYAEVKKLLHHFSPEKTQRLSKVYVSKRRSTEAAAEAGGDDGKDAAEEGKHRDVVGWEGKKETKQDDARGAALSPADNDKMFYHVMWHDRVRQPLSFFPRRLYFDFKPSLANFKSDAEAKRNVKDLISDRIQRWKEEGLLPEDYEASQIKVYDKSAALKASLRSEYWKKKPKFLERPEWSAGHTGLSAKGTGS